MPRLVGRRRKRGPAIGLLGFVLLASFLLLEWAGTINVVPFVGLR